MSFSNLLGYGTTESAACNDAIQKFNDTFGGCPAGYVFTGNSSTTNLGTNSWQCELSVNATGRNTIVKTGCSYTEVHAAYTGTKQGLVPWKPTTNCPVCFNTIEELNNWGNDTDHTPGYASMFVNIECYWEYSHQMFCTFDGHTNYDAGGACHVDNVYAQGEGIEGNNFTRAGLGFTETGTWNSWAGNEPSAHELEDYGFFELYKSGGDWKLWHTFHNVFSPSSPGPSFGPFSDAETTNNDNFDLDYTGFTPSGGTFFDFNFVHPANCSSSGCSYPTGEFQSVNGPWWLLSQVSGESNGYGDCYDIDGYWCGGAYGAEDHAQSNTFFRITGMKIVAADEGIHGSAPRCTQPITFSGVVTPQDHCEPCCEDGTTIEICGQGNTYAEAHADLREVFNQGYAQNGYSFVGGTYYDGSIPDSNVPYANSSTITRESDSCASSPSSSSGGGTPLMAAPIVEELDELEVLISKDVLISEPPVLSNIRGGSGRPPARRSPRPVQCCPPVQWIVSPGCVFCNPPRPASVRGPFCCGYVPPTAPSGGPQQPPTQPPTNTNGACITVCAEICQGNSRNPTCSPTSHSPSPGIPGCQPSATVWGPTQFQAECCHPFSNTLMVTNAGGIADIAITATYPDMVATAVYQGDVGYVHIDWAWPHSNPPFIQLPVYVVDNCSQTYWNTYDIFVVCNSSSSVSNGSVIPVCYPPSSTTFTPPMWSSGACCVSNACVGQTTQTSCNALGGTYMGHGVSCTTNLCSSPSVSTSSSTSTNPQAKGACCVSSLCLFGTAATCANIGGVYQGDNVACTPTLCGTFVSSSGGPAVPPASSTGACCFAHNCFETDYNTCLNNGGVYNGDGTACANTTCASFQCCDMQTLLSIGATGKSPAEAYNNLIDLFNLAYKPQGFKISILHPPEFNTLDPLCSSTTNNPTPMVAAPLPEDSEENDFYDPLGPQLSAVVRGGAGWTQGRGTGGGLIGGWHSIRWGGRPPWVGVTPPGGSRWGGWSPRPLCAIHRPWCVTRGGQWNRGVCAPFRITTKPDGTVVCEYDCQLGVARPWGGLCHYVAVRVFPPVQPPPGNCWGQAATICKLDGTWYTNPSCHSSPLPTPPCSSSGGIEFANESMTAECCQPFNYSNAVTISAGATAGACIKSAQAFAHNPDIAVTTFVTPDKKRAVYSVSWPDPGFTWNPQNSFTLIVTDCCDKVHTIYYGVDTRCTSSSSDYVSSSLRATIICAAPSRSSWNFPDLIGACCYSSGAAGCTESVTYAACQAAGGDWLGLNTNCDCCPKPSECAEDCLLGVNFSNSDINGYYKSLGYIGKHKVYQNPNTHAIVYFNYTTQLWEVNLQALSTVNSSVVALSSTSSAIAYKPDNGDCKIAYCPLGVWNSGEFLTCPNQNPCVPTGEPNVCEHMPSHIPHEVNTNKPDTPCGALYKARTPGTKQLEIRVPKIFTEDEVKGKWIVIADNCGKYKYYKIIKPTGGNP